jgi:hypothetical protein
MEHDWRPVVGLQVFNPQLVKKKSKENFKKTEKTKNLGSGVL